MNLRYISDPGHGWLEVPKTLLKELAIQDKITAYSYENGRMVYLEEDCDMATFMQACYANKHVVSIEDVYQERTPIRGYQQYALAA
jgi:hypothetical protein